jgi:hypothetical protein
VVRSLFLFPYFRPATPADARRTALQPAGDITEEVEYSHIVVRAACSSVYPRRWIFSLWEIKRIVYCLVAPPQVPLV